MIVTQRNDHFVILLPETPRDEVEKIVKKLGLVSEEKLGVKLKIGLSTFPDEEITFETLLQRAEAEMLNVTPSKDNLSGMSHSDNGKVEFVPAGAKNILST